MCNHVPQRPKATVIGICYRERRVDTSRHRGSLLLRRHCVIAVTQLIGVNGTDSSITCHGNYRAGYSARNTRCSHGAYGCAARIHG